MFQIVSNYSGIIEFNLEQISGKKISRFCVEISEKIFQIVLECSKKMFEKNRGERIVLWVGREPNYSIYYIR